MRKLNVLEMNRISVDEFKKSKKCPLVVILDNVRSMYNVGSVFRTADAFRIEAIYLCGITSCPPHPEIHKTALGAEDAVDWHYCKEALETVKNEIIKIGDNWISGDTGTYEAFKEKFEEKEAKLNDAVILMQEFVNNILLKIDAYESATQSVDSSFE